MVMARRVVRKVVRERARREKGLKRESVGSGYIWSWGVKWYLRRKCGRR